VSQAGSADAGDAGAACGCWQCEMPEPEPEPEPMLERMPMPMPEPEPIPEPEPMPERMPEGVPLGPARSCQLQRCGWYWGGLAPRSPTPTLELVLGWPVPEISNSNVAVGLEWVEWPGGRSNSNVELEMVWP